jgi:hypothetical protein
MKRILWYLPVFLPLALLLLAAPVTAKGPASKIMIEGADLAAPIEITDLDILNRFDPWGGQFFGTGGPLEWPPYVGLRLPYEVFFYVQNNQGESVLRYMFYYYPDPAGGRGYIYLPGSGEPYYGVNTGTIIRNESDGRWRYAMPTWDAMIGDVLQGQSVSSGGGQEGLTAVVWLAAVIGGVFLGVMILSNRRRELSAV